MEALLLMDDPVTLREAAALLFLARNPYLKSLTSRQKHATSVEQVEAGLRIAKELSESCVRDYDGIPVTWASMVQDYEPIEVAWQNTLLSMMHYNPADKNWKAYCRACKHRPGESYWRR